MTTKQAFTILHPSTLKPVNIRVEYPVRLAYDFVKAAAQKAYMLRGKVNSETVQAMLDLEHLLPSNSPVDPASPR